MHTNVVRTRLYTRSTKAQKKEESPIHPEMEEQQPMYCFWIMVSWVIWRSPTNGCWGTNSMLPLETLPPEVETNVVSMQELVEKHIAEDRSAVLRMDCEGSGAGSLRKGVFLPRPQSTVWPKMFHITAFLLYGVRFGITLHYPYRIKCWLNSLNFTLHHLDRIS